MIEQAERLKRRKKGGTIVRAHGRKCWDSIIYYGIEKKKVTR